MNVYTKDVNYIETIFLPIIYIDYIQYMGLIKGDMIHAIWTSVAVWRK